MQVIRDNIKYFLIFIDFINILNLAMNKLIYIDIYIYYVHYAVDPEWEMKVAHF
jgi:hypothetical protein